mgnify:CR=1 FL=1
MDSTTEIKLSQPRLTTHKYSWRIKCLNGLKKIFTVQKPKPLVLKDEVKKLSKAKLEKMTKSELEAYGRKFGYEVDRRETKAKIVKAVAKLK